MISTPGSPNMRMAKNIVTLPPGTHDHVVRADLDAVVRRDVLGDRLAQRQDAGRRRVAVVAVAQGLDRRLDDVAGAS